MALSKMVWTHIDRLVVLKGDLVTDSNNDVSMVHKREISGRAMFHAEEEDDSDDIVVINDEDNREFSFPLSLSNDVHNNGPQ